MAADAVYKMVELVGTSKKSYEEAIEGAIARASKTLHNLDWFEVKEMRGSIVKGKVGTYQVKLALGFRLDAA